MCCKLMFPRNLHTDVYNNFVPNFQNWGRTKSCVSRSIRYLQPVDLKLR